MKKLKKVASLAVAAAMITSSLAFAVGANAAETSDSSATAVDAGVQAKVQDGVILHAFNWSYNAIKENLPAIAAAGYSTVQTSPVQQPKDYGSSEDVEGQWWKLYQPVSMSIAKDTWLGTKDELKSLCREADNYGIKIICDIVSNHMGNAVETSPNSLSDQVKTYQPDFYKNQSTYFRSNNISASDSSIKSVVQGHVSNCPDIATDNENVQTAVINLLKECIDCGVDGFRFDAAKHIETPDDGTYASDYWPNITSAAESYYTEKTGEQLYIYGEILNTCGSSRKFSSYTNYINVTDNRTGDAVLANVVNGRASTAASANYKSGSAASDVVLWAESHDTYMGDSGSSSIKNTAEVSDENIVKAWSLVAARKDSTALYFARPGSSKMGEASGDITYKSTAVSEINKFHNLFVGQSEKLGAFDDVAYVARGTSGIVLANCKGNEKVVSIADTGIADGVYTDTITGNKFTVSSGVLSGSIGSTGVAVVYNGSTTPRNTVSVESCKFQGETITVELGLDNATSGTYCLDGARPVTYTSPVTIRIGSDFEYGETINLTVTATDGKEATSAVYKYTKNEAADSGVYLWMNPNTMTKYGWSAPYYVYIYDEDTTEDTTYTNAAWPGQKMEYDEATGYYYIQVSSKTCLINGEEGSYDLANSPNTRVIYNDGVHQYPSDGASATVKQKFSVGGKSKLYAETSNKSFTETDLVPQKKADVEATDVVRPELTGRLYGDADGDGDVTVDDATLIQKYLINLAVMPVRDKVICDVNGDGDVSIDDATFIQKYIANIQQDSLTGKVYTGK